MRRGGSAATLRSLIDSSGASAVYWNRLYEPALVRRDTEIKRELTQAGVEAQSFNAALLTEPWQILTGAGTPYKVFTAFYRACGDRFSPREPAPAPRRFRPASRWPATQELGKFRLLPTIPWDQGLAATWQPGEAGAARRLRRFCEDTVDEYTTTRDQPARTGVSYLSPHLHFGEISPHQIRHAVLAGGMRADHETYLRQLVWRDFAHYLLFHFPDTPQANFRPEFDHFPWRRNKKLLRAWCRGETGIPLIDAGMRELWHTGWMHNRVRMNVASFLTKNALLHWLDGARWFWDTLVDADLANNTLGWQWSAGCGADAAPYFRIFNPVRQGERFDPHGEYIKKWLPQLEKLSSKHIHMPWKTPPEHLKRAEIDLVSDYCLPAVDLQTSRDEALAAYKAMRGQKQRNKR